MMGNITSRCIRAPTSGSFSARYRGVAARGVEEIIKLTDSLFCTETHHSGDEGFSFLEEDGPRVAQVARPKGSKGGWLIARAGSKL